MTNTHRLSVVPENTGRGEEENGRVRIIIIVMA
jgi:hypothetical protein